MDIGLIIVSTVSVVVAVAASATAWRLYQRERDRTVARVAALTAAAYGPADAASDAAAAPGQGLPASNRHRAQGGRPALVASAVVLCLALAGTLGWTLAQSRADQARGPAAPAPLELISLVQARQNSKLTVSGLVRNPVAGRPLTRLAAVVFLFDRDGTLVGSGRAPVDFTTLGSGDESPFVVAIDAPAAAPVARYRVSFRTDAGLVPHVDCRSSLTMATTTGQAK